jgi:hypothetical protein
MRLAERDDGWWIKGDEPMTVTRVCVDHAFALLIADRDAAQVTIESAFYYADGSSAEVIRCQPDDVSTLHDAVALVHARCASVEATRDGTLRLVFDRARSIAVRPDGDYEAWNLVMDDGEMLVCTPNGEVAHFPARSA